MDLLVLHSALAAAPVVAPVELLPLLLKLLPHYLVGYLDWASSYLIWIRSVHILREKAFCQFPDLTLLPLLEQCIPAIQVFVFLPAILLAASESDEAEAGELPQR